MAEEILGVLGGMGPEATSYFFQQLIKATPAKGDSDHIKTIIYSNPQIPDRTQAILGKGVSPVEEMVRTAQFLERAGATCAFMPCVTAHYFVQDLQQRINIPVFNLLKILHLYVKENYRETKKIGILCTTGTRNSGIFEKELSCYEVIYSEEHVQEEYVMRAIYGMEGIKAGYTSGEPTELLTYAGEQLKKRGAEIIIMGCTEIPLALKEGITDIPTINILKIAAECIVQSLTSEELNYRYSIS